MENAMVVKNRLAVGVFIALIYVILIMFIPHNTPRFSGMESDLTTSYINGAVTIDNIVRGRGSGTLWKGMAAFDIQGIGYPAALWIVGGLFDTPVRAWNYFTAAKWISICSAAAILIFVMCVLGIKSGIIASVVLMINPIFLELSCNGCTDLFTVALLLWSGWCLWKRLPFWSGVLLGIGVISRYEYIIFLPFILWWIMQQKDIIRWRATLFLLVPLIGLLAINFTIAHFPPSGGKYNLALHYLNDDRQPDFFVDSLMNKYPTTYSIITADYKETIRIAGRDTWNNVAQIGIMFNVLLASALLWALKGWKKHKILIIALLTHFIIINFTVFYWATLRYYMLEMVFVVVCGSYAIDRVGLIRWKRIWVFVPLLLWSLNLFGGELQKQTKGGSDFFLPLRGKISPESSVLSIRPTMALVAGVNWRYWKPTIGNIYQYCKENKIDFVLYSGHEYNYRPEWRKKLSDTQNALPEFVAIASDSSRYILYWVAESTKSP